MAAHPLEQRIRGRLAEWEAAGLRRSLRPPTGIDLSSNDYLNLSTDSRVVEAFVGGLRRDGAGSTGSRLLRGERECFAQIERRFADFKKTERALFFGAGYFANIGVLSALADPGDLILSDERNHASLIDGMRLSHARRIVFPHNDVGGLERLLVECGGDAVRFVVIESLFSMDGDFAPLSEYAALCRARNAVLVVDEAHAVGIYGETGSGLIEACGVERDVCLSINTAGKALGVSGAFVAGPSWAIDHLAQRARSFVYSTAPPPAIADALEASLSIVAGEPERRARLKARAAYLRSRLAAVDVDVTAGSSQILSLVIGDTQRAIGVAAALQREGFDVRPIRPPTVAEGTSRLRVSVNAALSEAVLDRFVDAVTGALQEIGLWSAASL